MGYGDLIDKKYVTAGDGALQTQPTTFSDVFSAQVDAFYDNFRTDSKARLLKEGREQRDKTYQELEGRPLRDAPEVKSAIAARQKEFIDLPDASQYAKRKDIEEEEAAKYAAKLREQNPEKYGSLLTNEEIEKNAQERARTSQKKFEEVAAGATGFASTAGGLAGSVVGGATDPVNMLTMAFGAGAARSIFQAAAIEAGINAATEAAIQPVVADWQNEIGNEYGLGDALENIASAGVFGGLLGGGAQAIGKLATRARAVEAPNVSTREVMTDIQLDSRISTEIKAAAREIEIEAHLKETKVSERHFDIVENISRKAANGEPITQADIRISDSEFIGQYQALKTKENLTHSEKVLLQEMEKFVSDLPTEKIERLEQVTDGIVQKESEALDQVMFKDTDKPEGFIYDSAEVESFNPKTGKGKLKTKSDELVNFDSKNLTPEASPIARGEEIKVGDVVVFGKEDGVRSAKGFKKVDPILNKTPTPLDTKPLRDTPVGELERTSLPESLERQLQVEKDLQRPEAIRAEEQAFIAELEANPEFRFVDEDGIERSANDYLVRFQEDEAFQREISLCAIGGEASQ